LKEISVSLAFWRDLAIVWLALLCLIGLAVPLAAAVFAVKGTGFVVDRTPELLRKAQSITRQVRDRTDAGSRQIVIGMMAAQHRADDIVAAAQRVVGRRDNGSR
jgi:hypothetical protein